MCGCKVWARRPKVQNRAVASQQAKDFKGIRSIGRVECAMCFHQKRCGIQSETCSALYAEMRPTGLRRAVGGAVGLRRRRLLRRLGGCRSGRRTVAVEARRGGSRGLVVRGLVVELEGLAVVVTRACEIEEAHA